MLRIENEGHGINSLTSARMLVRMKSQSRVDTCVKVEWDSGEFDI